MFFRHRTFVSITETCCGDSTPTLSPKRVVRESAVKTICFFSRISLVTRDPLKWKPKVVACSYHQMFTCGKKNEFGAFVLIWDVF